MWHRLPSELVSKILLYLEYQPKALMEDIKSYVKSKDIASLDYYNFWLGEWHLAEDRVWLLYDISAFINRHNTLKSGYVNNYFDLFRKMYMLQNSSYPQVFRAIKGFNTMYKTNYQINVLWGLMTLDERTCFLNSYCY
jgi:hypothetical protein